MTSSAKDKTGPVSLSGGTWGKLSGGIATIVVAAAGWANSMKADLQTVIVEQRSAVERLEKLEHKIERIQERMLGDRHGAGRRQAANPPDASDGS